MAQGAICRMDCSKRRVKSNPCRHAPVMVGPNASSAFAVHANDMAAVGAGSPRRKARREDVHFGRCDLTACHVVGSCATRMLG